MPPKQPWEDLLELNLKQKLLIYRIYGQLLSLDECSMTKTRVVWEQELAIKFKEESWNVAIKRTNTSSLCAQLGLIQFKVLHRVIYKYIFTQ